MSILMGPTVESDARLLLQSAEAELTLLVLCLDAPLSAKHRAKMARELAGVVSKVEIVRLWLMKPAVKHCEAHDEYKDSCHECYERQYRGKKGEPK